MSDVRIPVLEYHLVLPDDVVNHDPNLVDNPYTVPVSVFQAQVQTMLDLGCTPVDTAQAFRYLTGAASPPARPVLITFDDGYEAVHRHAYPILAAAGYKFVMFVIASYIADTPSGNYNPEDLGYTTWQALQEMVAPQLCDVQNHTWNLHDDGHGNSGLVAAAPDQAWPDLLRARHAIEINLGTACTALAYPHGQFNDAVQWLAAYSGHRLAFSGADESPVQPNQDFMALPRYLVQKGTSLSFLGT